MVKLKVLSCFKFLLYYILTMETALGEDTIKHQLLQARESLLTRRATGVKQEVDELLCELQRHLTTSSMIFADAGGKLPAGVMVGNTNHFGHYEQCLSIDETVEEVKIQGKYCVMQTRISLNDDSVIPVGLTDAFPPGFTISGRIAVCVPDACPASIDSFLPGVQILADELYCRRSNDKPIAAQDIVAIVIFSILTLLLTAGTAYQLYHKLLYSKDVPKIVKTFSAYHQVDKLTTLPSTAHPLSCISGIRTISTLWIILGHHYALLVFGFVSNPLTVFQFIESFGSTFIIGAALAVDTFFFLAAFLLTWTLLKKVKNRVNYAKSVPIIALNRYLRLTPVLAAAMLLRVSFFNHVSDSPFHGVDFFIESCLKGWWVNMLYVQNYLHTESGTQCMPETWYLAFDMQLNLAAPIVIIFLLSGLKSAIYALTAACVTALGAVLGYHFFMYRQSQLLEESTSDSFGELLFRNTTTATVQFLIGIVVAYVLFQMKKRNISITNKLYKVAHWVITAALLILPFYGVYSTDQPGSSQATIIVFNAWHKPAWVLGVSGVIVACMHGFGGPVQWFLELKMWTIPARLSYGLYLLHCQVLPIVMGFQSSPTDFSNSGMLSSYITIVGLTVIASCFVYIFVEAPFADLTNMLMAKISGRRSEDSSKIEPSKEIQPSSSEEVIKNKQDQ